MDGIRGLGYKRVIARGDNVPVIFGAAQRREHCDADESVEMASLEGDYHQKRTGWSFGTRSERPSASPEKRVGRSVSAIASRCTQCGMVGADGMSG